MAPIGQVASQVLQRMQISGSIRCYFSVPPPSMARQVQSFTYSKSPGLLSMPTLGGAIHEA